MTYKDIKTKIQQAHDWIDNSDHGYNCQTLQPLMSGEDCTCGRDEAILGLQLALVEIDGEAADKPLPEGFALISVFWDSPFTVSDVAAMGEGFIRLAGFESEAQAQAFCDGLPKFLGAKYSRIAGIDPKSRPLPFHWMADRRSWGHAHSVIVEAAAATSKRERNELGYRRFARFAKAVSEWAQSQLEKVAA